MAFLPLFLFDLIIVLVIIGGATGIGIVLLIVSIIMKKRQMSAKKQAEFSGNTDFKIKKTYLIFRISGIVFMIPIGFVVCAIGYAVISEAVTKHTSLSYNMLHGNTARVEKILRRGVSPDCTEDSNKPAENGQKTLLYRLAEGILSEQYDYRDEPNEYVHEETLKYMEMLIENGADVNCTAYSHKKDYASHGYEDEYSIYRQTDQCGWTPLMEATYYGDFDMIKLLVENGADVNAVDYCGYNVIDIVADFLEDDEGYEILEYYLDKGVDPFNETNLGQNALFLSSRHLGNSMTFENEKIRTKIEELYGVAYDIE